MRTCSSICLGSYICLEYANSVWSPYRQGLINDLDKVQMRATKLVLTVKHLKHKERLMRLQLPTLRYRRMRGDMIQVYKILTNKYTNINFSFEKQQDSRTRGHSLKLVSHRHHYDLSKYSFSARIANTWSSYQNQSLQQKLLIVLRTG